MSDQKPAIVAKGLTKKYMLYNSQVQFALDAVGISRVFPSTLNGAQEFKALNEVDVIIGRGERVGIIGRNGAGKTTLLKLVTQNYIPSSGTLEVNGKVQSLMDTGLGFHPDFTGLENIKASLSYNGLNSDQKKKAIEEIIDFVELGDFINQPIKTYSLGMGARLGFATATAIEPDILIIDEVLGAGDGYFAKKSSLRMKKLTSSGATLLLVSHSTQQILEFCERCIWMDSGKILMDGDALTVVKAYEKYLRDLENQRLGEINTAENDGNVKVSTDDSEEVSKWETELEGPRVKSVEILDDSGKPNYIFHSGQTMKIKLTVDSTKSEAFKFSFGINFYTKNGIPLSVFESPTFENDFSKKGRFSCYLNIPKLLYGTNEYTVSVGIYKTLDLSGKNESQYYQIVDRSYEFKVFQTNRELDQNLFKHPAVWQSS